MFDTESELLEHIQLGEDSRLELKDIRFNGSSVSSPNSKSMADELAAMANSHSGVFVLGVDDKSKSITGIPVDKLDIVETWIRNICHDLIEPQLYCHIAKVHLFDSNGKEKAVVRVDVDRSLFVHKAPDGYFYRVGSSKREMSTEFLARIFQQRSQTRLIYFDEQAVPGTSVNCLDKKLWDKFRTSLSPDDDKEFLVKMNFITEYETGVFVPTVSGILMVCSNPQDHLRSAYIQAVAYSGTVRDSADQLDAKDITGPLDVQIRDACLFVRRNMKVRAEKEQWGREDRPQYSMRAIFEAIVNAVAHRDYSISGSKIRLHMFSDRVEIFSPGSIPNSLSVETLPFRQISRNSSISSLLARCSVPLDIPGNKRTFIMDRRGEGVPVIINDSAVLSGIIPVYQTLDNNAELLLTIYAANNTPG
ncbi:MAG: putative DNA binding domain-containing protein [Succinivibrionaceae bacterium]|nr:putative DNA binding domain-containing protein [Succinivibrionaceae bacterium]